MDRSDTASYAGLDEALALARRVHSLHRSRDGNPYFAHAAAVLERTDRLISLIPVAALNPAEAEQARILAVLHDVVEERAQTGVCASDLLALGFDPRIVAWITRLSGRPAGMSYQDNVRALAAEPDLAPILVKLADNDHNMDPDRIAALPPGERDILHRYERSSAVLADELGRRTGIRVSLPILGGPVEARAPAPAR